MKTAWNPCERKYQGLNYYNTVAEGTEKKIIDQNTEWPIKLKGGW